MLQQPVTSMPKRGKAQHNSDFCPRSGLETIEARRRRLCPSAGPTPTPRPPAPAMPSGRTGAGAPQPPTAAAIPNRPDAPVVRNLHRGSVAAAVAGLELHGADALVQDLVRDRTARTSVAPGNTHLKRWIEFHGLAYPTPPAPPVWPSSHRRRFPLTGTRGFRVSSKRGPRYT